MWKRFLNFLLTQYIYFFQFGLCTFHYDPVKKLYRNRAFNFYVWPRPFSRAAPDPRSLNYMLLNGPYYNLFFFIPKNLTMPQISKLLFIASFKYLESYVYVVLLHLVRLKMEYINDC